MINYHTKIGCCEVVGIWLLLTVLALGYSSGLRSTLLTEKNTESEKDSSRR